MTVLVSVTSERTDEYISETWDTACGRAVTEALAGATSVVISPEQGPQVKVMAALVEDNS